MRKKPAEKKPRESGGVGARNPRQGFRSEDLAKFALSTFGTAVQTGQGNDIGIDLMCISTDFIGSRMYAKHSYQVQVKSKKSNVVFVGDQVGEWLSNLESPLLLAFIDKSSTLISIYSTWNHQRLHLAKDSFDKPYPSRIVFKIDDEAGSYSDLPEPDINTGIIDVGKPILEFTLLDIGNDENAGQLHEVLDSWLKFETEWIHKRKAGVPATFGYISWQTNKPVGTKDSIYFKPYYFSDKTASKARENIGDHLIALGLYLKKCIDNGDQDSIEEFEILQSYVNNYLSNTRSISSYNIFKGDD